MLLSIATDLVPIEDLIEAAADDDKLASIDVDRVDTQQQQHVRVGLHLCPATRDRRDTSQSRAARTCIGVENSC